MMPFRLLALTVTAVAGSAATGRADIVATFDGTIPSQDVSMVGFGSTYEAMPVGPFQFSVTGGDGTFAAGSTIRGFCADFDQALTPGQSYPFVVTSPSALPDVGPDATKLALIDRLFERHYGTATDADRGGAFQLALWELLYDGPGSLDLNAGNIDVTSPDSVNAVAIAKSWLAALETPDPTDADNYTVIGLFNANNQDQLTVVPNNPVPAPAGAVLGLVALGGFGLRRLRRKAG